MLITPAYAQTAGAAAPGGGLEAFLPLILIFVIFYFLLIRPQQKKMKEHKSMLEGLRRGDKVVTGGGILATVTKVGENEDVTVEIAEGVKIQVLKGSIQSVESRGAPQKAADGKAKPGEAAKDGAANDDGTKKGGLGATLRGLLGGGKKDS